MNKFLKTLFENDLEKESTDSIHRWISRPIKKGNRFTALLFFASFFGLCYYDALIWSYQLFHNLGFIVIRCLVAILLVIPNIVRFPLNTEPVFIVSYLQSISLIWLFGFMDGLTSGPGSEKYEKPGIAYLFPLFIFGNTVYLTIADVFGAKVGFYRAINESQFGFYPIALIFICWPIFTKVWYEIEKAKANKKSIT